MRLEVDYERLAREERPPIDNDGGYYGQRRPDMQLYVPKATRRLLDIGCSGGYFGGAIRNAIPSCEVWGIEPSDASSVAAQNLDKVLTKPLNECELPEGHFDVVTMNDSLEHIFDTDGTLAIVKRALAPDGMLILSLPNIAYYVQQLKLVWHNDWLYTENGILDRTHCRFFTTKSIRETLERNGFVVETLRGLPIVRPPWYWRLLFSLSPRRTYWLKYYQFAVVARPAP